MCDDEAVCVCAVIILSLSLFFFVFFVAAATTGIKSLLQHIHSIYI